MNIGGVSFGRGIAFSSGGRRARAVRDRNGSLRLQVSKTVRRFPSGRIAGIPFVRGLAAFVSFRPMLILLLAAVLFDLSPLFAGAQADSWDDAAGWLALALAAVMIIVRLFFLRDALKYHAAEHMALNAYESGKTLTTENILASPRTHPRCGTMLAIYIILTAIPLAMFIPYTSAVLLLSVSVSYELFLYVPKIGWLRWLSSFGLWLQKTVTTAPPEPRHVELARECLLALLTGCEKQKIGTGSPAG